MNILYFCNPFYPYISDKANIQINLNGKKRT